MLTVLRQANRQCRRDLSPKMYPTSAPDTQPLVYVLVAAVMSRACCVPSS